MVLTGGNTLTSGLATLSSSSNTIDNALKTLDEGSKTAYDGSNQLVSGVETFKNTIDEGLEEPLKQLKALLDNSIKS